MNRHNFHTQLSGQIRVSPDQAPRQTGERTLEGPCSQARSPALEALMPQWAAVACTIIPSDTEVFASLASRSLHVKRRKGLLTDSPL